MKRTRSIARVFGLPALLVGTLVSPTLAQELVYPAEPDVETLARHYARAEKELRAASTDHLSEQQRSKRAQALDWLQAYREDRNYGRNLLHPGTRQLYFIDPEGRRCAVACLLDHAGENELVERIAATNNHAYVAELADVADQTLERLLISGNAIEALSGLGALSGLLLADVSQNRLSTLAGLDNHPLLVDLFAADNAISELDPELELLKTLPYLRTLVLKGNPVAEADSAPSYRHRVLYNLPTILDLDGVQVLSEEKVAAQNAHGDNTELLAAVSAKYFPPGNPCEVELFPGEFGQPVEAAE